MSLVEQRYQVVLAVISDGETLTDLADRFACLAHRDEISS